VSRGRVGIRGRQAGQHEADALPELFSREPLSTLNVHTVVMPDERSMVPDLFVKWHAGRSEHPSSFAALVSVGHAAMKARHSAACGSVETISAA
jgi:hypothetical protein